MTSHSCSGALEDAIVLAPNLAYGREGCNTKREAALEAKGLEVVDVIRVEARTTERCDIRVKAEEGNGIRRGVGYGSCLCARSRDGLAVVMEPLMLRL